MIRKIRALSRSRSLSRHRSSFRNDHAAQASQPTRILNDESDDELSVDDIGFNESVYDLDNPNDEYFEYSSRGHESFATSSGLSNGRRAVPQSPDYHSQLPFGTKSHGIVRTRGREERNDKTRRRSLSKGRSVASTHVSDSRKHSGRRKEKNGSRSKSMPRKSEDEIVLRSSAKSPRGRSKSRDGRNHIVNSKSHDSSEGLDDGKKRKSKMEKILQLQEKNQRYKEEFRRVQKDRKALKKEIELRKEEITSLTKEIDSHVAETTNLKQKLSEALHQLDAVSLTGEEGQSVARQLQQDLQNAKDDYNRALSSIDELKTNVNSLETNILTKEDFIRDLEEQVRLQKDEIERLHVDNEMLLIRSENLSLCEKQVRELSDENERIRAELDSTVQQASCMVKEREDAIADLLRENDELKRYMTAHEESAPGITKEELSQLKLDLAAAVTTLEEAQDRNMTLEEELEILVHKSEDMDAEQLKLRDELEAWQEKATAAEQAVSLIERNFQESEQRAQMAESKLAELEQRYKDDQIETEKQHKAALAAIEKAALEKAMNIAESKAKAPPNPQEMMLQAAVANQQKKQAGKMGWFRTADDNASHEDKRVKELESTNAEQEEEIQKLKSELVRLRSTFNDTMYTNKKRVEQLESENTAFKLKISALEKEIVQQKHCDSSYPDMISTSSNNSE